MRLTSFNHYPSLAPALAAILVVVVAVMQTGTTYAFDSDAALESFRKCRTCHEIGGGAENKVGPQLNGLQGRSAAGLNGFKYSKALREAGKSGLVWDESSLDKFLSKPRTFIKGTRMSFTGLKEGEARANLIKWLLHFSPDGLELADPDTDIGLLGGAAAALDGDPAYGKYLSGECVTCHQLTGGDSTIPAITGWPKENFIHVLYEYKTKARTNPVMQTVTGRLGDEEMAALAAYFGSLPAQ